MKEEVINGTLTTTQLEEAVEGGIRSERVQDFPRIWDGDYLFFHYVEQGEAEGKHGSVLKCRGRGYSFKGGSMQARNYFMIRGSKSYSFASEQEYLTRDGILSKSWVNLKSLVAEGSFKYFFSFVCKPVKYNSRFNVIFVLALSADVITTALLSISVRNVTTVGSSKPNW